MSPIELITAGALLFGGGLQATQPDDGVPALVGLRMDARWFATDDAFAGGALAWSGGADDRNPERVLLTQMGEAVALLGYHLSFGDGLGATANARAGIIGIHGSTGACSIPVIPLNQPHWNKATITP